MTERPPLTKADIQRLLAEFLTTTEPPGEEELRAWLTERGFEEDVADPLYRTILMSATVMLTAHIVSEYSNDEELAMPSPQVVSAMGEIAAAVGITFFLIGWDLAVQAGATR